jgi:hypothetical protein
MCIQDLDNKHNNKDLDLDHRSIHHKVLVVHKDLEQRRNSQDLERWLHSKDLDHQHLDSLHSLQPLHLEVGNPMSGLQESNKLKNC